MVFEGQFTTSTIITYQPKHKMMSKLTLFSVSSGLVIYFSVDSDPVLCEQKRKKRAGGNVSSKQK